MKLIPIIITFSGLFFFMVGCGSSESPDKTTDNEKGEQVQVSEKQFESEGMQIGALALQRFDDEARCNGYIVAHKNGLAQVSAPLSGIVHDISCNIGDYVRKGQTLCRISGNDLMLLQQEFVETSVKLHRLKTDYERSKALYNEKIGTEKDFIAIESEYKTMQSKYLTLKLRLGQLNLDFSKIEAGEPYGAYAVTSPIDGNITSLNLVIGQYTEQQAILLEIVDIQQLQLQLSVFENDVYKVKAGQSVRFNTLGEPAMVHNATILSTGKSINPESRTISCFAKIENKNNDPLINQSYIEATITVDSREAMALPSEALIKSGKDYFVFIIEKHQNQMYDLRRKKVTIGQVTKDFTEIVGESNLTQVLIKGVYNLPVE